MKVFISVNESWIRSSEEEEDEEKQKSNFSLVGLKKSLFGKREYKQWKNWNIALIEKNAKLMFILEWITGKKTKRKYESMKTYLDHRVKID